jgi:hypothetical protein
MTAMKATPHSADVRIHLHVNGRVFSVAQLGPDFLVLRAPVEQPPCDAEIAMSIDGRENRWVVRLVDGIQVGRRKTAISRCLGSTEGAGRENPKE